MTRQTRLSSRPSIPPDHVGVLIAALLMIFAGWGGLATLVRTQEPFIGQRWLFLLLLHIAVAGTMMPIVRYINVRLTPLDRILPPSGVVVRQSVWFGLFTVACAWLQMPRVLSPAIMFFLALAFVVVEVFLRSREIPNERLDTE